MGKGYSVLEIITKFEEVTGLKVKKEIVGRRQRRYCRNICSTRCKEVTNSNRDYRNKDKHHEWI